MTDTTAANVFPWADPCAAPLSARVSRVHLSKAISFIDLSEKFDSTETSGKFLWWSSIPPVKSIPFRNSVQPMQTFGFYFKSRFCRLLWWNLEKSASFINKLMQTNPIALYINTAAERQLTHQSELSISDCFLSVGCNWSTWPSRGIS